MKKLLASVSVAFLPALALAQTQFNSLQSSLSSLTALINQLIPFAIGLAVLVFIFGLIQFVTAGGDEEKRKAARNTIIWGIIVIFVMTSVWGLVNVLKNSLNLQNQTPNDVPSVPGTSR